MITVAGVTFSMTLLAVSHASSQYGPRLLTGFMRDRGNQLTLGTFISTFIYCLIVLRTVHSEADSVNGEVATAFVPHFAVLLAVVLAILSVTVLIYFIHHIPQSINVSNVIAGVGTELVQGVDSLYPEQMGGVIDHIDEPGVDMSLTEANARSIFLASAGGYLRVLDAETLLAATVEHDLVVALSRRPGDFAIPGQLLMRVWPAHRVTDDIVKVFFTVFSWGEERTREQDVMFPVEQLIEVLGKAMSPGVNGQYTAILCLNQLERGLAEMLSRPVPDSRICDDSGSLRVIASPITHQEFVSGVFRPVRQFVRDDWLVTDHVLKLIDRLIAMPKLAGAVSILRKERELFREEIAKGSMSATEKHLLQ